LAFFYWLVDLKGFKKWARLFIIVGMNSIFIYLFANILSGWLREFVGIWNQGFLGMMGLPDSVLAVTNAFLSLGVMCYLSYFLYRHKIFFRV
jgi:predicted acyltransferase